MRTRPIGGEYLRVAEPDWRDPVDASYAQVQGGRWNAPGAHATLYLNADIATARANVQHKYRGLPYGPEDLDPAEAPHLVHVPVPPGVAADAVSEDGLVALGLPASYPIHRNGEEVTWQECQPIGAAVFVAEVDGNLLDGIACRSAADGGNEELAYYVRDRVLEAGERSEFPDWYWPL
jgi:hypothetical protein